MQNFFVNLRNNQFLFLVTLGYFALGFLNVHFALLAVFCMGVPLFLLFRNKQKTWCQGYCPRSMLYRVTEKITPYKHLKMPNFLVKYKFKRIVLVYFCLSMIVIIMSTMMVVRGRMEAMNYVRFLIVFPLWELPQLFTFSSPAWLSHLSYRFYSMMFTTTVIGLLLAIVYRPRTWCVICPMATISDIVITRASRRASG